MTVIRTSLRRKIIRTATPLVCSVIGVTLFAFTVLSVEQGFLPETEAYGSSIENMNSSDPAFSDEAPSTEVYEQAADEEKTEHEQAVVALPKEEEQSEAIGAANVNDLLCTLNLSGEKEDLTLFDVHSGRIYEETFGSFNGPEYIGLAGGGKLRNCTEIPNDEVVNRCLGREIPGVEMYSEEPQVLILHTHTTESYEPYIKDWYDERYTSRSYDPNNSVVAVGAAIAEQLSAEGISVIHDCTIHDSQYSGAYGRSLSTAVDIMSRYPSIRFVLDIHRDAIEYSDGSRVSAVTEIDGRKAAQVMIICAADDGTYDVPAFYDNLSFACELEQRMESMFPTLTRPILFQYCQYNQQVSPGALLIEVGSHGNSIDEAVYSGELIGRSLASLLKENTEAVEAVPVLGKMPFYFFARVR